MTNHIKTNLQFSTNQEIKLDVGKVGEPVALIVNGYKTRNIPYEEFKEFDLKSCEAKSLTCKATGKDVFYEGKKIIELSYIFDEGRTFDVKYNGEYVVYSCGDVELQKVERKAFEPGNIFQRRRNFKAKVEGENEACVIRYANLHQHTEYSLFDGMLKCSNLAKETEYACAITDHGSMYGYFEFYKEMKKRDKKPIIGIEIYIERLHEQSIFYGKNAVAGEGKTYLKGDHMVLLAKDATGLKNLYKIVRESYDNFYTHPHVTYEILEKYKEGLIATSACIGGTLGRAIESQNYGLAKEFILKMKEMFGDDFYIELQNHRSESEKAIMDTIAMFAKRFEVKTTVGVDAHFLSKDQEFVHEIWLCLQRQQTIFDQKRFKFEGEGYYLHSTDEVCELFKDYPDALDGSLEIADKCNVEIKFEGYHLPIYPLPAGFDNQDDYFKHLCREGFKRLYKGTEHYKDSVYLERMQFEINTICSMGWPGYFLIVQDFIAWAKDKNVKDNLERYFPAAHYDWDKIPKSLIKDYEIPIGPGRGSAAGSQVANCLGITKVNPNEYDLLFERFMSPDRISMPDIDIDISDEQREEVIDYVRFKYGQDKVARIITFGTAAAKAAVKDIARVFQKPVSFAQKIADAIPNKPNITLDKAYETSPEFRELCKDEEVAEIVKYAKVIEGMKKNVSQHACGVLISDKPLTEYLPVVLIEDKDTGKKIPTAALTMSECEEIGCLKMDFLGLRTLSVAKNCIDLIEANNDVKVVFDEIPIDDVDTYKFISKGETQGVFQLDSPYMRDLMQQLYQDIDTNDKLSGMDMFHRLSDANALGRPGPMDEIPNYIHNMLHPEDAVYDLDRMKERIENTHAIIVYQEQMMLLVQDLAGFSKGQADTIRKGMAKKKKEILDEYGTYFIEGSKKKGIKGCINNGISREVAKTIWDKMEKFGAYAFNKSHSVSYSMLSARTAWLVNYYPVEYMTAVLNSFITQNEKLNGYVNVTKRKGIELLPPDVNISEEKFVPDNGNIRFGLMGVKGVKGNSGVIVEDRKVNGPYKSLEDFVARTSRIGAFNKTLYESLVYAGAFDGFGGTRKTKIEQLETVLEYSKAEKDMEKSKTQSMEQMMVNLGFEDMAETFRNIRGFELDEGSEEFKKQALLKAEKEKVGFYVTGHPVEEYYGVVKDKHLVDIGSINDAIEALQSTDGNDNVGINDGQKVKIMGVINDYQVRYTKKNNDKMSTFKIDDPTGVINCVCFPKNHADNESKLGNDKVVMIEGRIKVDDFGAQIQVNNVVALDVIANGNKIRQLILKASPNLEKAQYQKEEVSKLIQGKPGQSVVMIDIGDERHILAERVDITLETLKEIQNIIGEQNCIAKYR